MRASFLGMWVASAAAIASAATPITPTFIDRYDYVGCSVGDGIAVGDINGDGIPDLVCPGTGGLVTLLGNGNGTFRSGPESSVNGGDSPLLIDVNGDGKLDLISSGEETFIGPIDAVVSFGNGDGTFQPGTVYSMGTDKYGGNFVGGDFNGDGILDFAVHTESGVWLFTGQGGGVFNQGILIVVTAAVNGNQLAAVDLNGDGILDLIAEVDYGFAVLLGNGNGTFDPQVNTSVPHQGIGFAVGDFNSDGKADLFVATNLSSYGYLYLGSGNGTFTLAEQVNEGSMEPFSVAAADLNGDGFLDVVTAAGEILFGNGKGQFSAPVYYPSATGSSNWYVLPADLRYKGRTDLVFSDNYGQTSVLLNGGKGKFQEGVTVPISGGAAYCAVVGDFNGDGIQDLAVAVADGISILLGTGKASSPYTQGQLISYSLYSCPVEGDLNNDGITDLFVTTGDNFAVGYLGNGDGTFTQAASMTPISTNGAPVLGDFNGDGKLDFALSSNLLAYGNGDGTFQTPAPYIPKIKGDNIVGIAAGRLRSGELSDIVLTDIIANIIYVLLSTGHGFEETTFGPASGSDGPINPVLADINQDGYPDLLVGCSGSEVPIYLNNGEGVFTYAVSANYVQPADGAIPLVADVNGDGIPDVVIQGNGDLGILTNAGSLTFSTPLYIGFGAAPGPVIAVDAHGQAIHSGKPDLITPDATGVMNIFFNTTK